MQMHSHNNSAQEGKNTTVRTLHPLLGNKLKRINSARVWADEIGKTGPIQNLEGK
jgi:hypothetical protein